MIRCFGQFFIAVMSHTKKQAGFLHILSLVVGAQLGMGALMLPRQIAQFGIYGIVGWIVTGAGAIVLALIFAALSQEFQKTGGPHVFIKEAFGERSGKVAAWTYWIASIASIPPAAIFAIGSLDELFGPWNGGTIIAIEIGILFILMLMNFRGLSVYEIFLGSLRVLPLFLVPFLCFGKWDVSNISIPTDMSPFSAIKGASFAVIWAFIGLETGTAPGEKVKNSKKIIPIALIVGTVLTTVTYISNSIAVMGVIPLARLAKSFNPYSDFLQIVFGWKFGAFMLIFTFVVCIGNVKSWLLSSADVSFGAAIDGLFPSIFAGKNKGGHPTSSAVICTALLAISLVLSKSPTIQEQIMIFIDFCNVAFVLIYFVCIVALAKFMVTGRIIASVFKWALIVIGTIFCLYMMSSSSMINVIGSLLVPIFGFAMSFVPTKKQA